MKTGILILAMVIGAAAYADDEVMTDVQEAGTAQTFEKLELKNGGMIQTLDGQSLNLNEPPQQIDQDAGAAVENSQ